MSDAYGFVFGAWVWGFAIVLVAAAWVYSDAKSRGVRDPAGWAILVILFFIVAMPLYLVKRPTSGGAQRGAVPAARVPCPRCREMIPFGDRTCDYCGAEVPRNYRG